MILIGRGLDLKEKPVKELILEKRKEKDLCSFQGVKTERQTDEDRERKTGKERDRRTRIRKEDKDRQR